MTRQDHLHLHRRSARARHLLAAADHSGLHARRGHRRRDPRHLARRPHPRQPFPSLPPNGGSPTTSPSSASWPRRPMPTSSSCRTSAPRFLSCRPRSGSCSSRVRVPDYPEDPRDDASAGDQGDDTRRCSAAPSTPCCARATRIAASPPRSSSTRAKHPHSMGAWSRDSKIPRRAHGSAATSTAASSRRSSPRPARCASS